MYAPHRSSSPAGILAPMPESSSAIIEAPRLNWRKRSRCLSSRLSIHFVGSQFLTSHANFVAKFEQSNWVIGAAPLLPASRADHVDSRSLPIGVTRPIPVMTTRLDMLLLTT